MRQFVPIRKQKKTKREKKISRIQKDRMLEEQRKPRVKRNGILIKDK